MQNHKKCHENVWILSGTADGPILARRLLELNYSVFISVVSYKASKVYPENNKLHIITGRLIDENSIQKFIFNNEITHIIDATHPFAQKISENLENACRKIQFFKIYKYERRKENYSNPIKISDFRELANFELKNKNILLAIGSRSLDVFANFYINSGANVYARILATPEAISKGLSSCVRNSNIAILNPSKEKQDSLESYLCNYWKIDYVLCRESGSYTQELWDQLCLSTNKKLFLLKRPKTFDHSLVFSEYDELIQKISIAE